MINEGWLYLEHLGKKQTNKQEQKPKKARGELVRIGRFEFWYFCFRSSGVVLIAYLNKGLTFTLFYLREKLQNPSHLHLFDLGYLISFNFCFSVFLLKCVPNEGL